MIEKDFKVCVPPRNPHEMKNWSEVIDFDTAEEALKYVQDNYGADENGWVCLVRSRVVETKK